MQNGSLFERIAMIPTTARWVRSACLDAIELRLQARPATWLWAVLIVAFLARTVVAAIFTDLNPAANLWEYGSIAIATIEHGHGQMVAPITLVSSHPANPSFVYPTAFEPPFLIWVWMGLFLLFGVTKLALAMMTALNVLTGVGIVYYSIRVARALFGSEVIAFLVGIIMALHPVFVYSVTSYQALNVYILLLLIVFDLTLSTRRQTYAISVLVGVLAGIAALVRLEYVVLAGAVILGSLITHRQWKMTAVAAVAAFVVIAPWTARNYSVFHRLMPMTNDTGYYLFIAYNPEANGDGKTFEIKGVAERFLGHELNALPLNRSYESARDKVFYNAAVDYIKSHPLRSFVVLPLDRAALFWCYDFYDPITHELLYQLQLWPLFVLSIVGLAIAARSGCFAQPDHRTVLILFAFQTLVMMVYTVFPRYRMNVEPFLYAYAAVGAVGLLGWLRRRLRIQGGGPTRHSRTRNCVEP
jgi:hypothetical protein